ncbi:MAG: hydroxylamine reductase [Candidatus Omnitrophota bacterium]
METKMYCRQCEQTAASKNCTVKGVCGKSPETAALQDLLIHSLKGIAYFVNRARELGIKDSDCGRFVVEALFSTVTNVNFDSHKIAGLIREAYLIKENIKSIFININGCKEKHGSALDVSDCHAACFKPAESYEGLLEQAKASRINAAGTANEDIASLKELLLYGLKGMAAYADHALILGEVDEDVMSFFHKALDALCDDSLSIDDLFALNMEFGKVNLKCLEILDFAHTKHFGNPAPRNVSLGVKRGPAIIVSGHDLYDLEQLLKQTQGTGVNVYTHGEMLPAHGYPGLNKYEHLAGHFGSAWQNQQAEFDSIKAVILMTTNCIQEPKQSYKDRIFTTGLVAWPGVNHIESEISGSKDFSQLIEKAKELGGVENDQIEKTITVGFSHHAVLSNAGKIVEAVKDGKIKHFFLIGGCDGAKPGRNYYTDFAKIVPPDCVILTLACGKFRFNRLDFGDISGIPRLLDCGQCNDAYSAVKIVLALAEAFNCSVNDLPLSLIISWYEQKAVCILLSLLSLGIKDIRLGPTLPAFVSPNILKVLVEKFAIRPVTTPDKDLGEILKGELA